MHSHEIPHLIWWKTFYYFIWNALPCPHTSTVYDTVWKCIWIGTMRVCAYAVPGIFVSMNTWLSGWFYGFMVFRLTFHFQFENTNTHRYIYYWPAVDFLVVFWGEPRCIGAFQWMLCVEPSLVANVWKHQPNSCISMLSPCFQSAFEKPHLRS